VFGNNIANTQTFTGSVYITGSFRFGSSNQQTAGTERIYVGQNGAVGIDDANSLSLFVTHTPATGSPQLGLTYQFRTNDNASGNLYGDAVRVVKNAGASSTYTVFTTNSTIGGGTERMRIDSSGNVGIGITPSYALDVANSSSPSIRVRNGALGGTATLLLETANNFSGTCQTYIQCIGSTGNGTSQLAFATSRANGDTTATEAMRIASGGALVINGTTAVLTSTNRGNITLSGTASSLLGFSNGSSYTGYIYNDYGANLFQWVSAGNTIQVVCSSNGVQLTSGATSWSSISDERLKNITGNIENAVNSLMTLRTIKHTWKSDDTNKENLGLVAQDVQKVFPQVIDINKLPSKLDDEQKDETEYLAVRYTELVPVLVKAIQELKTQNDALQSRIETLESK
jgi:hypothetical protein